MSFSAWAANTPLTDPALRVENLFSACNAYSALAVAVSGGADSIALMYLALQWRRLQPGRQVFILTVDHGLRVEAAHEAERVKGWCAAHSLAHCTLNWQAPLGLHDGVQAKARAARYSLMTAWCLQHQVYCLLTGHTLDDQAETVWMRQQRTSSSASLQGIRPIMRWHNGVNVVRPLLGVRHHDLRAFLNQLNQPWIEDPSNQDMRFERVRVRAALALQSEQAIMGLADIAQHSAAVEHLLLEESEKWLEAHLTSFPEAYGRIDRQQFMSLAPDVAHKILQRMILLFGGRLAQLPERAAIFQLYQWIVAPQGLRRTLGGCLFALRQRDILVGREWQRINPHPVVIPAAGHIIWDGRFKVVGQPQEVVQPAGCLAKLAPSDSLPAFVRAALPQRALAHNGPYGTVKFTLLPASWEFIGALA